MTSPTTDLSTPGDADVALATSVFKALGDPVRLQLYRQIAARSEPICVCELADVGVAQPTVSHHLRKLREAGLIDCERRGTWVYYWPLPGATLAAQQLLTVAPPALDLSPGPECR